MGVDKTSYQIAINDALLLISGRQGELDNANDNPLAAYALDELETLYQRIAALGKHEGASTTMTFREAMMSSSQATEDQILDYFGEEGVAEWHERRQS